jgi:putative ABC transport system ATP-binding protein
VTTATATAIDVVDVGHRYDEGPWLFRGITRRFEVGTVTGVVGPSGSGKSTFLAVVGDLLRPAEGEVVRPAVATIAWLHQAASGIPRRTALDHVVFPMLAAGRRRRDAEPVALGLLDRVGLATRARADHRVLSGGEAQRVALARALACDASFVIADEPTAQLDRATAAEVARALGTIADGHRGVIVATHDPLVIAACDTVVDLGGDS